MTGGKGKWMALLAVGLAFVAVAGVNLFSALMLHQARVDVTEERLFTISQATRRVLERIDEPITLKLYFSRALAEKSAAYAGHGAKVRTLLRQYAALAPGKLRVEIIDPEPYSRAEDIALAAGLQPAPLPDGRNAWFGIMARTVPACARPFPSCPPSARICWNMTSPCSSTGSPAPKSRWWGC